MELYKILEAKNPDLHSILKSNIVTAKGLLEKCTPTEFTFHGYNHSKLLENYINKLVPDSLKDKLTTDEIFILLNAVYYHDIGMISYSKEQIRTIDDDNQIKTIERIISNRSEHNIISMKMIYDDVEHKYHPEIIKLPNNDVKYAKSIGLVCLGHRDYKDGDNQFQTLDEIDVREGYTEGWVHTRILACILRLADELDVTNQRAPEDVLIYLKSFLSDFSLKEWTFHQFIRMVDIQSSSHRIKLIPDFDNIKKRKAELIKSGQVDEIYKLIFSKIDKIKEELKMMQKYFESVDEKDYDLGYQQIEIEYSDEILTNKDHEIYEKEVKKAWESETLNLTLSPEKAIKLIRHDINKENTESKNNKLELQKKIDNLNEDIKRINNSGNLIDVGFFKLSSGYYSKFNINSNYLISNSLFLKKVSEICKMNYNDKHFDFIVAIDKSGMLMGSRISLSMKTDFTYMLLPEDTTSIKFEKELTLKEDNHVLIITDIIASGFTLRKAVNYMRQNIKVRIDDVFNIFCGDNNLIKEIAKELSINIFTLNNTIKFPIYSEEDLESNIALKEEFSLLKTLKIK